MEALVSPVYLNKGDTIGIIAPSRKVRKSEIIPFLNYLNKQGFKVECGKHLYDEDRQFSGTTEQRLRDFLDMLLNPQVKAVFAARGGYGAAQLLNGMDWEVLRENPKWIVGFSDFTVFHAAVGKFMKTIHGVMPISMVMEEAQEGSSFDALFNLLKGNKAEYKPADHPLNIAGEASGSLTGGNLSVLYSLAGTQYEPDYENKILFLEDLDEYLYHIDRMMLNFELRDVFRKISGLVVGSFSDMHDNNIPFGKNALEIIAERVVKYSIPTLFDFPAGHKKMNLPLIFGGVSTLRVKKGANSLTMY